LNLFRTFLTFVRDVDFFLFCQSCRCLSLAPSQLVTELLGSCYKNGACYIVSQKIFFNWIFVICTVVKLFGGDIYRQQVITFSTLAGVPRARFTERKSGAGQPARASIGSR
jgi:hypothetical protein